MSYPEFGECLCECGDSTRVEVDEIAPEHCVCGKTFISRRLVYQDHRGDWQPIKPAVPTDTPWGKVPPCRGHALEHPEEDVFMVPANDHGFPPVRYASSTVDSFCDRVLGKPAGASSNGGSTAYYRLPAGATELNDLIEHKRMSFALGNIFKACYRFGEKDAASRMYDLNKIIYFAERLKALEERRVA